MVILSVADWISNFLAFSIAFCVAGLGLLIALVCMILIGNWIEQKLSQYK
tara:strand:+ start:7834 stop:7983 length:150 start_codon:yes stop_codon:yes gene_type:complete